MWLLWVALLLLLLWIWRSSRRPSWSPRGPALLPLIGNLWSLDAKRPHLSFDHWAKCFGALFHCKFGVQHIIVLSDPDMIREAFSKPEITARPDTELFKFVNAHVGLAASSGQLWHETRRLTLHNLRNLGMGKSKLEAFMHSQIQDFMDQALSKSCGTEIEVGFTLNVAIVNIIWKMVASEELRLEDSRAKNIMGSIAESLEYSEKLSMLDSFPWLQNVLPESAFDRDKLEKRLKEKMWDSFIPAIEEHRVELSANTEPADLIDALLQEQLKRPEFITDWHIVVAVADLFFAGNDTTAATLRWGLCFLCEHPDVQRRLQQEIDTVVDRDRLPALSDRMNMPYTDAVILEIQRMGAIAPIGLPHATTARTTIGGFQIPAGVQVISNIYSVHYNPLLFPNPHQFNPDRFIDAKGKFQPDRNVMPFSAGRRQCLGEGLARAELFLFLTGVLQSFSFRWPEGFKHDLSDSGETTVVRKPAAYKLIPERR